MRILVLILIILALGSYIFYYNFMRVGYQHEPILEPGKYVDIRNISYTKSDSILIKFDVVNDSQDTLYVLISEWMMNGISSKFKKTILEPLYNPFDYNIITYSAVHPKFVCYKYMITDQVDRIYDKPFFKYLRLEPKQKQQLWISIDKSISKSIIKSMNKYKFRIQVHYYDSRFWTNLRKAAKFEVDKFVIKQNNRPMLIQIYRDNEINRAFLSESENIHYMTNEPMKDSRIGQFILK